MTERAQALEAALRGVLASAHPHRTEHPTMWAAWENARLALEAVQSTPPVGSPTRVVKLNVIEFHPQPDLRERFYAVVDDLRASGSIVDLWLHDIAAVLKEFDYDMQITTRKP